MKIVLENFRSFAGRREIAINPLTVLVGENSSGKSSFLAAVSALSDPKGYPLQPGFNNAPYNLGNYETIATYKGGSYGRAKHFILGYVVEDQNGNEKRAEARYTGHRGQVMLESFTLDSPDGEARITLTPSEGQKIRGEAHITLGERETRSGVAREIHSGFELPSTPGEIEFNLLYLVASSLAGETGAGLQNLELLSRVLKMFDPPLTTISMAPIRTKPERTYSELLDTYQSAGDLVPFILERMLTGKRTPGERRELATALERFGRESGLFEDVSIRKLGKRAGAPFQILVKVGGRPTNLVDVGYGVSQVLPIIVQSELNAQGRYLLLQEPEVHLHPRAQAALGTFFVETVARSQQRMIIETHSDFIIDRARLGVAEKKIRSQDIRILFFDKPEAETSVYPIDLDEMGNLVGAPPSYREFLLREEVRILTRPGNL